MNCSRARELLCAFLDDELGPEGSLAVQAHLEACPDCAREAEAERQLGARLRVFGQQSAMPVNRTAVRAMLRAAPDATFAGDPAASRSRRWVRVVAFAAILVAVALAIRLASPGSAAGAPRTRVPFTLASLADDFEHFLTAASPLHVQDLDQVAVTDWMRHELAATVELPPIAADTRLVGARRCDAFTEHAAFALYEVGGAKAAVVVTRAPTGAVAATAAERVRSHNVVICRQGDLAYGAVGPVPEAALRALLPCGRQ